MNKFLSEFIIFFSFLSISSSCFADQPLFDSSSNDFRYVPFMHSYPGDTRTYFPTGSIFQYYNITVSGTCASETILGVNCLRMDLAVSPNPIIVANESIFIAKDTTGKVWLFKEVDTGEIIFQANSLSEIRDLTSENDMEYRIYSGNYYNGLRIDYADGEYDIIVSTSTTLQEFPGYSFIEVHSYSEYELDVIFYYNEYAGFVKMGNYGNFLTLNNFTDMDRDRMNNLWESANQLDPFFDDSLFDDDLDKLINYNEFINNTDPQNPDSDGDCQDDATEVIAGTDPLNKSSLFQFSITKDEGDSTNLTWTSSPNRAYTVYFKDDPYASFSELAENIPAGQGTSMTFKDLGKDINSDGVYEIKPSSNINLKQRLYKIKIRKL